jgi:hypothetical protein
MAGKLPVSFPDRYQHIATFTDDNSRHKSVAFMHPKSQLSENFTAFRRELQVLAWKWAQDLLELESAFQPDRGLSAAIYI